MGNYAHFKRINDWLVGIMLNSDDQIDKDMAAETIDLIKEQSKWLKLSTDMFVAYQAGYERGKDEARQSKPEQRPERPDAS